MPDISATEAARNLSDLLDAVEHRGEHFRIIRRGKPIAMLEPASRGRGAKAKAVMKGHRPNRGWRDDLARTRALIEVDERS